MTFIGLISQGIAFALQYNCNFKKMRIHLLRVLAVVAVV